MVVVEEKEYLLPDTLSVQATLVPELRRYGIHETAVYTAVAEIVGASIPLIFRVDLGWPRTTTVSNAFLHCPWSDTELRVDGTWPEPGFDGAFLPTAHRVDAKSFEARRQVLDLSRRLPQRWHEGDVASISLADSAAGVSLVRPANAYQQNVRPENPVCCSLH